MVGDADDAVGRLQQQRVERGAARRAELHPGVAAAEGRHQGNAQERLQQEQPRAGPPEVAVEERGREARAKVRRSATTRSRLEQGAALAAHDLGARKALQVLGAIAQHHVAEGAVEAREQVGQEGLVPREPRGELPVEHAGRRRAGHRRAD